MHRRVLPGSHKRDVAWRPGGVELHTHPGEENHALARYEELRPDQQELFVELTGKAGTAVIFTHDLIHTSWHETDTYRRVVHLTFGSGYAQIQPLVLKAADLFDWMRTFFGSSPTRVLPGAKRRNRQGRASRHGCATSCATGRPPSASRPSRAAPKTSLGFEVMVKAVPMGSCLPS